MRALNIEEVLSSYSVKGSTGMRFELRLWDDEVRGNTADCTHGWAAGCNEALTNLSKHQSSKKSEVDATPQKMLRKHHLIMRLLQMGSPHYNAFTASHQNIDTKEHNWHIKTSCNFS